MDPWGTPEETLASSQEVPSRTTRCCRLERYSWVQSKRGPEIMAFRREEMIKEYDWGTESKAFLMSKKTADTCLWVVTSSCHAPLVHGVRV